jgi:transposase
MKFMARTTTYPKELRERAIRLVLETSKEYPTEYEAIRSIAAKLGIGSAETLRKWVRQAQVDSGQRPGVTTAESEQIKALKRENAELRRANEILKSASAFFAAELCATRRHGDRGVVGDRPHRAVAAAR